MDKMVRCRSTNFQDSTVSSRPLPSAPRGLKHLILANHKFSNSRDNWPPFWARPSLLPLRLCGLKLFLNEPRLSRRKVQIEPAIDAHVVGVVYRMSYVLAC